MTKFLNEQTSNNHGGTPQKSCLRQGGQIVLYALSGHNRNGNQPSQISVFDRNCRYHPKATILTQRREGAKKYLPHELCASAPLREALSANQNHSPLRGAWLLGSISGCGVNQHVHQTVLGLVHCTGKEPPIFSDEHFFRALH